MIRSLLIAAGIGALLGALITWFLIASPRIEIAATAKDAAETALATTNDALDSCKLDAEGTRASLEALREQGRLRSQAAIDAMNTAMAVNRQTGEVVQQILAEQTPPGMDACEAASQAFDAELRQERSR